MVVCERRRATHKIAQGCDNSGLSDHSHSHGTSRSDMPRPCWDDIRTSSPFSVSRGRRESGFNLGSHDFVGAYRAFLDCTFSVVMREDASSNWVPLMVLSRASAWGLFVDLEVAVAHVFDFALKQAIDVKNGSVELASLHTLRQRSRPHSNFLYLGLISNGKTSDFFECALSTETWLDVDDKVRECRSAYENPLYLVSVAARSDATGAVKQAQDDGMDAEKKTGAAEVKKGDMTTATSGAAATTGGEPGYGQGGAQHDSGGGVQRHVRQAFGLRKADPKLT